MQTIKSLTKKTEFQNSSMIQNTHSETFDETGKALTVMFFSKLKTTFGKKFEIQFKGEKGLQQARREWYSEISKLNVEAINRGFEKLKHRMIEQDPDFEWPDVAKAIALCANDHDLPNLDETIAEIIQRHGRYRGEDYTYSHRLIELVAKDCGYFVTREPADKFERRARVSHAKWVKKAQKNELPAATPALELKIEAKPVFKSVTAKNPFQARIDALRQKSKDLRESSIKITQEKIVSKRRGVA
ncbi:hypothetical protein [Catenovulum sediminis]|uniref:Uncharacterized protein n=1 Tax=Catenovulum sediminis TaxID=1740262 RepID=A0ABV1RHY3_9ALTE